MSVWHWSQSQFKHAAEVVRNLVHRRPACLHFSSGSRCVKGPIRETNEDRCYADQRRGLFIVADGMGGHAAGGRASQTVIEVIAELLSELLDDPHTLQAELGKAMVAAVFSANQELTECARVDVSLDGMGSTVVIGIVRQSELLLCSVGDSRVYLARQNELRQLTVDDTLVQGLVNAGALTVSEAATHPMRHVLMHSVGTRRLEKQLEIEAYSLYPDDRLLFTTDGLTDTVSQSELMTLLADHDTPHAAAAALTDHAQESGSRDNITCIVVELSL